MKYIQLDMQYIHHSLLEIRRYMMVQWHHMWDILH